MVRSGLERGRIEMILTQPLHRVESGVQGWMSSYSYLQLIKLARRLVVFREELVVTLLPREHSKGRPSSSPMDLTSSLSFNLILIPIVKEAVARYRIHSTRNISWS